MSATYTHTIAIDDVCAALIAYLQPIVGAGVPIIRGQQNRSSMPTTGFLVLTELKTRVISTAKSALNDAGDLRTFINDSLSDWQIDYYGASSGDWASMVARLFASGDPVYQEGSLSTAYAVYADDPMQTFLTNAEKQYEARWTGRVTLQYNDSVSVTRDSADTLAVNVFQAVDLID